MPVFHLGDDVVKVVRRQTEEESRPCHTKRKVLSDDIVSGVHVKTGKGVFGRLGIRFAHSEHGSFLEVGAIDTGGLFQCIDRVDFRDIPLVSLADVEP